MRKLRVALFGTRFIAGHHAAGWKNVPGAKIVGLYSPSGHGFDGRLGQSGNIGGDGVTIDMEGVTCSNNPRQFYGDGYDVIDICTPTFTHGQFVRDGLAAGKNVICEKPLVLSVEEALELKAVADRSKGQAMVAYCMRFWPGWMELPPWLKAGAFGDMYSATFRRVGDMPGWSELFRDGEKTGGALIDLMSHDTDFVLKIWGKPQSVMAAGCNVHSTGGALDDVTAILRYPGGRRVVIETSWARHPKLGFGADFEVRCRDATITGGFAAPGLQVHGAPVPDIAVPHQFGQETGWEGQLHYFTNCIQNGQPVKEGTLADAVECSRLLNAIKRSVETGEAVAV